MPVVIDISGGIVAISQLTITNIERYSQAILLTNAKALTMHALAFKQMSNLTNLLRIIGGDSLQLNGLTIDTSYAIDSYVFIENIYF